MKDRKYYNLQIKLIILSWNVKREDNTNNTNKRKVISVTI